MCANFDDSSFSRSSDMVGVHQTLNGSQPFQGWFVIHGLALDAIKELFTKFEVYVFTQFEDTKSDSKCRKSVGLA